MRASYRYVNGLLIGLLLSVATVVSAEGANPESGAKKYRLRYQFQPGETLRWEVIHQTKNDTTISGTTKRSETYTKSVKVWKVSDVKPDGTAQFVCSVEQIEMRQKMTGNKGTRYNSQTDKTPPPGFVTVASSVNVPLVVITLDPTGKVLHRKQQNVSPAVRTGEGQLTVPLPKEPVPVGHVWSFPFETHVSLNNGMIKRVKTRQTYTLEDVSTGVATIRMVTQILTPVDDPAIRSQLMHRESIGTIRFDIASGRVLSQQTDVDKEVVGFRSSASSTHYVTRATERFLPPAAKTAVRTAARHARVGLAPAER